MAAVELIRDDDVGDGAGLVVQVRVLRRDLRVVGLDGPGTLAQWRLGLWFNEDNGNLVGHALRCCYYGGQRLEFRIISTTLKPII